MVHDFNQAVFGTLNFQNLAILNFPVFAYGLDEASDVRLNEKNWIISVTASQKKVMCATHCLQAIKSCVTV